MKKTIRIGEREFNFKKDAIVYYKVILNSYNFGESLNDSDYEAVISLLSYGYFNSLALAEAESIEKDEDEVQEISEEDRDEIEENISIEDIQVSRVQFSTKCFEVFYSDDTSEYISYLMLINNTRYNPEKLFYVACRNSIRIDINGVKRGYFALNSIKGQVKCQETGILSSWTELVVDHRQPITFSMIVDRFKEVNIIDLETIEYTSNQHNQLIFKDENMADSFRDYHKAKANLRIVRKECNSSRSGMARIKKTAKDLTIK